MKQVVSFSVYGKKPMYVQGAIENAKLMSSVYPGWKMVVYCEDRTPTSKLKRLGVEIHRMGKSNLHSGMLWRFLPAWDEKVERVIFRDTDSRINPREAAAVEHWIQSGKKAHCMHDHVHHASLPIFGGMWGVMGKVLAQPCPLKMRFRRPIPRVGDMKLLARIVLPQIQNSLLRHSSVPIRKAWGDAQPFPKHEPWEGFVGQQFDDNGKPVWV